MVGPTHQHQRRKKDVLSQQSRVCPPPTDGWTDVACQKEREANRERYHTVWKLVKENYLYINRLTNWNTWEHKFDNQLQTDQDTNRAISKMLGSLDDSYTYLRDPVQTEQVEELREQPNVVDFEKFDGNIGYLKLTSFRSERLPRETRAALEKLGSVSAYVIDLRDNEGGLVDVAFKTVALFVDDGLFISYVGRHKDQPDAEELMLRPNCAVRERSGLKDTFWREPNLIGNKPIVILVNQNTRSAAEMFAGALRYNCGAHLVGTQTFGKGIIQDVWELSDSSSVKITTSRYFLPNGECIHNRGLTPTRVISHPNYSDSVQLKVALTEAAQLTRIPSPVL